MAESSPKIKKLIKSGDDAFHIGDYDKAISSYYRAIRLCGASERSRHDLIDAYNGMGHTLRSKGQFAKAKKFNLKALEMARKLKSNEVQLLLSLHYTADVMADLNQIDAAMKLSKEELSIARRLYKTNRKNLKYLVYGLNTMAARLSNKRKYKQAVTLLKESIRAQQKVKGAGTEKSYPNMSWTYQILGSILLSRGDVDGAIDNLKKALQMRIIIADKNKRYIGALKNTLSDLSAAYTKRNTTTAKSARGYL